jgi:transketolase
MALAARLDKRKTRVICFMSDGGQDEGQVWEAYALAGKQKLSKLIIAIDRNKIQIDGYTEDVMPLEPFVQRLEVFGLGVIEIDGHNFEEIIGAVNKAKAVNDKPTAIIMHTIAGKGVGFMEGDFAWHGRPPVKPGEAVRALSDIHKIRTLGGQIISEHE